MAGARCSRPGSASRRHRSATRCPSAPGGGCRFASRHWAFFDWFVTAETHWLAPDNQSDPEPVVAMRTSPNNIGLQLLSTVSAQDLGLLALGEMTTRLERTMATLLALPRHRGHFYNWYDLDDPLPSCVLQPAYNISTVDSGTSPDT